MTFLPHQERVVDESIDLSTKTKSLCEFIRSDTYRTLPMDEQDRLGLQLVYMTLYGAVLKERIQSFLGEGS